MTVWDNIYINYQKGGEAWATLSEELLPEFRSFIQDNDFAQKSALDIGCGTGKYLIYLEQIGFRVSGVDSSETAIEMTKGSLGDESDIVCANMFEFKIPENKFDLIFSISTLHHGSKEQVRGLINQIYDNILPGGKIFITLPDYESSQKWDTFKNNQDLGNGTLSPLSGPEKGLPHSFFLESEIQELFSSFRDVNLFLDNKSRWYITGRK